MGQVNEEILSGKCQGNLTNAIWSVLVKGKVQFFYKPFQPW